MLIMPENKERYFAALRNYVNFSINKYGVKPKHYAAYKKIMLAEIFCLKREKVPVDIIKLTDSILGASVIILLRNGIWLSTELNGKGTFFIDIKSYTAILLEICAGCKSESCRIIVTVNNEFVSIISYGTKCSLTLEKLVKKYGTVIIKEKSEDCIAIKINIISTEKASVSYPQDWQLVTDRFSAVRVFLSAINNNNL